jgi:type II secretory pathway pseudopilin PulG
MKRRVYARAEWGSGKARARSRARSVRCWRARRERRRLLGEAGELLIETLITISLVGLGVVAIVAALGTVIDWGNQDRTTTRTEALLWSYAEALSQVPYEGCTAAGPAPYAAAALSALPAALPDGTLAVPPGAGDGTAGTVILTVSAVKYWNSATAPATFVATCPASDAGSQSLTLTASSGDGKASRTLTIYKRRA